MKTNIIFTRNRLWNEIPIFKDFIYRINKSDGQTIYYKCSDSKCKARLVLRNKAYSHHSGVHNHGSHLIEIMKLKAVNEMRQMVIDNPLRSLNEIFKQVNNEHYEKNKSNLGEDLANNILMNYNEIRKQSYSMRNKLIPREPDFRQDIVIPPELTKSLRGEQFLLINDGNEDKIIIYATIENLKKVCDGRKIFCDGTFKSCSKLFEQIYTIHVFEDYGGSAKKMVPMIYALLPDKSQQTYERFFILLKNSAENNGLRFEPNEIQVDFENATIKAIEKLFPNCTVKGCLFHFTQAIWRKVQSLGLARFYNTDIRVRKLIHRIMGLSLLPIEKFQEVWDFIFEDCPENCKDHLDYFVTTWFDELNALFHRDIWNQFGNREARTNNHVEGWHNSFNQKVNESHPSVYRLINFIRDDQEDNTKNIIQLSQGISLSRKRTPYATINQQIINLWMRFQPDSQNPILSIEFLDQVGFLLHKN